MRAALPWLTSLVLHSLLLSGIFWLSRTPPNFPKQLSIDFQLLPEFRAAPEPVPASPPAPPAVKVPEPRKETPRPLEKKPEPAKPLPPPPKPAPQKPSISPAEVAETPEPQIPPLPPAQALEPAAPPPSEVLPAQMVEAQPLPPAAAVTPLAETTETVQYLQTLSQIRGQVLNKLHYPRMARKKGWYGKLVLGFILCTDGSVEDLEVVESSGHKVLDLAALQAVASNAPFKGDYSRTLVRLPINFQLE
jgi:protein TonB